MLFFAQIWCTEESTSRLINSLTRPIVIVFAISFFFCSTVFIHIFIFGTYWTEHYKKKINYFGLFSRSQTEKKNKTAQLKQSENKKQVESMNWRSETSQTTTHNDCIWLKIVFVFECSTSLKKKQLNQIPCNDFYHRLHSSPQLNHRQNQFWLHFTTIISLNFSEFSSLALMITVIFYFVFVLYSYFGVCIVLEWWTNHDWLDLIIH